ncbi:MAG TPA: amino acid adenylation domain-containing protein, partial [Chitinophaga sp.]|nr:amino acid adenylation domain-containing protein [Chitinophaga sp.]
MENLLRRLKENNISVSLDKSDLKVKFNGAGLSDTLIRELKDNKVQILEYLTKLSKDKYTASIAPAPESGHYPLSSSQKRLWVLSQLEEGNIAYNMPGVYVFEGKLDQAALTKAFNTLIARHESLRTVFREDKQGNVRQFINPQQKSSFSISFRDLRQEKEQEVKVERLVREEAVRPFDLYAGPLLRAGLLQVADNRWIFTYTMHHIISDGWSMNILIREVLQFYNAYVNNGKNPLSPLRIHYKDYAVWQQEQLSGEQLQHHRNYWLQQFEGELPVLELRTDKPRPSIKTYSGGAVSKTIGRNITTALKSVAQEQGATLFMGLLAGVNALLHRYTGQEDFIIGSPIAGREHMDLDDQIGFYLNTLALRARFRGQDSYLDLLKHIKQVTLGAYEHQVYPLDELIDEMDFRRDRSRNPLFDVVMVLQNNESAYLKKKQELAGLQISEYNGGGHQISKFDLSFYFVEAGDEIHARLEYNTDLYAKETVLRLANHLEQLLAAIADYPSAPLCTLNYLSAAEKEQLLVGFNDTDCAYPREKTIVQLFEEQAALTPDNIAVAFKDVTLTYRELNEQANRLGDYLCSNYWIRPDDLVGIKLERSEKMIVAIMGILKSGGAYVPIDPAYPQDRIDFMLLDSGCKVVIDADEWVKFERHADEYTVDNPPLANLPGDLAYVIYTSGTTGKPKGTLIEHNNVVRLLKTEKQLYDFRSTDVWTMFHSYCFDFSVWEMYGALLYGGKVVVVPAITAKDPEAFIDLLCREGVTVLNQTPSAFDNLVRHEQIRPSAALGLRYVIFGGEALNPGNLKEWRKRYPGTCLVNMYGITETTVHVTYKEITEKEIEKGNSNIGVPIPTLRCYVLDQYQQLMPVGTCGELYVGGEGVARGYLNREELTAKRFIPSPFNAGERLYRSGDKVKLLENGEMEYLGRIDDQVKIRGYRIEL